MTTITSRASGDAEKGSLRNEKREALESLREKKGSPRNKRSKLFLMLTWARVGSPSNNFYRIFDGFPNDHYHNLEGGTKMIKIRLQQNEKPDQYARLLLILFL